MRPWSVSPLTVPSQDVADSNPFHLSLTPALTRQSPSPQGILVLARQGHPVALATLLNYALRRSQVKARVQRQDRQLHILLESPRSPDADWAKTWLSGGLFYLHPALVEQVVLYGRASGERAARWQQEFDLGVSERNVSREASASTPDALPLAQAPSPEAGPSRFAESAAAVHSFPPDSSDAVMVQSLEHSETADWLRRPEAVVLLIFVSLLVFWDTYVSLLEEVAEESALTSRQLAQRLGTSRKVIRRQKQQPDFAAWTQQRDPDGLAWTYKSGSGFVPLKVAS